MAEQLIRYEVQDGVAIYQALTLITWILYGLRDLEWARTWAV